MAARGWPCVEYRAITSASLLGPQRDDWIDAGRSASGNHARSRCRQHEKHANADERDGVRRRDAVEKRLHEARQQERADEAEGKSRSDQQQAARQHETLHTLARRTE